jgi:hypothetical protein
LRRLPQELRTSLGRLLPKSQWPEFKEQGSADLETLTDAVQRDLRHLYRLYVARSNSASKITIVLDEVDRIVPDASHPAARLEEYESLFGLIRGLGQGLERILVCMVAGFSADITQKDVGLSRGVGGNPVYAFFNVHRLGPMGAGDIASMMNGLGSRARLQFTDAASQQLYQWSGGHPFLARLIGSVIHLNFDRYQLKRIDTDGSDAYEVDEPTVHRAAKDLLDDVTTRPLVAQILERFNDPLHKAVFTQLSQAGPTGRTRESLMSLSTHVESQRDIGSVLNDLEVSSLIRKEGGRFKLFARLLEVLIREGYV